MSMDDFLDVGLIQLDELNYANVPGACMARRAVTGRRLLAPVQALLRSR